MDDGLHAPLSACRRPLNADRGRHVPLGNSARGHHGRGALPQGSGKGVAICPGDPFYETERDVRTFRINYSNSSDEAIEKGIRILGEVCGELLRG